MARAGAGLGRAGQRRPLDEAARRAELHRIQQLADLLDSRFRIPGTRWNIGLDGLIGLIPGIGDAATGLVSLAIVAWAARLGAPKSVLLRMLANVGADVALGSVPIVGDLFDIGFKANRRNADLLLRFLQKQ